MRGTGFQRLPLASKLERCAGELKKDLVHQYSGHGLTMIDCALHHHGKNVNTGLPGLNIYGNYIDMVETGKNPRVYLENIYKCSTRSDDKRVYFEISCCKASYG